MTEELFHQIKNMLYDVHEGTEGEYGYWDENGGYGTIDIITTKGKWIYSFFIDNRYNGKELITVRFQPNYEEPYYHGYIDYSILGQPDKYNLSLDRYNEGKLLESLLGRLSKGITI